MSIPDFIKIVFALVRREWALATRRKQDCLHPLLFFLIIVTIFPLAISPEPAQLQLIAPGVIWVAALLASLLALPRLFQQDFDDATLEQFLLSTQPMIIIVFVKIVIHWLLTGIPLIFLAPLLAVSFSLSFETQKILVLTLLLGTPTISFIGAIGSALTIGLREGGVLLSLLILPLFIPVLVFGTTAIGAAQGGFSVTGHLALLGALLALSISLAPWAISAALRVGVS